MQAQPKNYRRSLWLYIPVWIFFVYLYIQILSFHISDNSNLFLSGMYFIQFGIHEASHIVFMFLPPIITASAGSLGEILFTVLIVIATFRAKAYFAGIFGALWFMLATTSAGQYMADAKTQAITLIGPSEAPQHDWHFVFEQLGWLNHCVVIGDSVRTVGYVVGAIALGSGLVIIFNNVAKNLR